MVVQAIALLDDLDKEINIYAMRVKVRSQPTFFLEQRSPNDHAKKRNGTGGISPKWPKSLSTTLHTRRSFKQWVSHSSSMKLSQLLILEPLRLPYKRCDDILRRNPPRGPRSYPKGSSRDLHGHRNIGLRYRPHSLPLRPSRLHLSIPHTARRLPPQPHDRHCTKSDCTCRRARRRETDKPRR